MQELRILQADDWHVHLRDGAVLQHTVPATARSFRRAIVMPNLLPPVMDTAQALAYRERILTHAPADSSFDPLMVLYLTDQTAAAEIATAKASGHVQAVKLYPAGATTNSAQGVTRIENVYPVLEALSEAGMPLLVHGEVTDGEIDIFDREKVFIDRILQPVCQRFPQLKIVLEHITTKDAVQFVTAAADQIAATITVQHLLYNRNHMLVGGVRPHLYCLPVLKRNVHQQSLQDAVVSGNRKFFLGTDSAPHAKHTKETACGCAGCYTAPAALELYAEIFESLGALDRLEAFASCNGPDFYGLPRNRDYITLRKQPWLLPQDYSFGEHRIVPLKAGETLQWQIVHPSNK
jgi:dihydroorotase